MSIKHFCIQKKIEVETGGQIKKNQTYFSSVYIYIYIYSKHKEVTKEKTGAILQKPLLI